MPHLLENKRRHKFVAWSLFGLDSHFVLNEAHACSSMDFSHIRNNDRQIYFAYGVLGLKYVETQLHMKISKLPSHKTSTCKVLCFYSTWGQNSKTRLKEGTSTISSDRSLHHMTKDRQYTRQIVRLITANATRLRNSSRGHFLTSPMRALSHTYIMWLLQTTLSGSDGI